MRPQKPKKRVLISGRPAFPSEWLCAEDLKGKDVTLTICRITEEEMPGSGEFKPTLHFKEMQERPKAKRKMLGCNVTNARSIADVLGSLEMDDWVGGRVTFYATTVSAGGEVWPCIRVRDRTAQAKQPPKSDPPPQEKPANMDSEPDDSGVMSEAEESRLPGGD